jgi:AcrR family transcriptional regulator
MAMKTKAPSKPRRRQPQQLRARQTVEAVLDAVTRVLKREGLAGVTTNRIAEIAGVSIGSLYQYFPDKRAIFIALRDRHVAQMGRLVESKLVDNAAATLEELMRGLIDAMIEAHAIDPALFELLLTQVPQDVDGEHDSKVRGALRLAIASRAHEFERPLQLDRMLFVLTQMMEALAHAVVLRRPASLSLTAAKEETLRAVLAYLDAHGRIGARSRTRQRAK